MLDAGAAVLAVCTSSKRGRIQHLFILRHPLHLCVSPKRKSLIQKNALDGKYRWAVFSQPLYWSSAYAASGFMFQNLSFPTPTSVRCNRL